MHHCAILRSVHHNDSNHGAGNHLMTTGMSTGLAGKSWYQAEYHGEAPPVQPAVVPSCSSARDARSAPPMPTQKAAELSGRLQTMRGWTQLPETAENARSSARTT
jgi:hypothetical protein